MKWKPKEGEEYFCITEFGNIEKRFHCGTLGDFWRCNFGDCLRTRKEAEIKLKTIKKILRG